MAGHSRDRRCMAAIGDLDHIAVEHFDEAVYSSNLLYGPENGFLFPGRAFFCAAVVAVRHRITADQLACHRAGSARLVADAARPRVRNWLHSQRVVDRPAMVQPVSGNCGRMVARAV